MMKGVFYIIVLGVGYFLFQDSNNGPEIGYASYYSNKLEGHKTASGEEYENYKRTAAHRTYPFGTIIKVTNVKNGKSVLAKVNDRGPYVSERLVDLSYCAADQIGLVAAGVGKVSVEKYEGDDFEEVCIE